MLTVTRILGIEIAPKRLIAVEVDSTTDPPAIREVISGEAPPTGLGEWLRGVLAEGGITARDAHLVLSDPDSIHRIQLLPP